MRYYARTHTTVLVWMYRVPGCVLTCTMRSLCAADQSGGGGEAVPAGRHTPGTKPTPVAVTAPQRLDQVPTSPPRLCRAR